MNDNYIIIVVNRQNKGPFFPCPFFSTLSDRTPADVYSVVQVPDGLLIISLVLLVYFRLESNSVDIYTIMGQERAYYYFASVVLRISYWTCISSGHRQKFKCTLLN